MKQSKDNQNNTKFNQFQNIKYNEIKLNIEYLLNKFFKLNLTGDRFLNFCFHRHQVTNLFDLYRNIEEL